MNQSPLPASRLFVSAARRRFAAQDGITLIEVLVSAALVLVVAGAILGAVDRASTLSGISKAKGVAAQLAQQDQERLRSLRPAQLANKYETRTLTVNGTNYTVVSEGTFVSEATRTPGCTSTARADFLKIVSTVRSPALSRVRTIHLESLVNPAVGSFGTTTGSMVVQVRDAAGSPVSGLPVTITGPGSYGQATSAEGCAFFAFVPVGAYTISYGSAGWVDMSGSTAVTLPGSVSADQTASYQTTYDRAGELTATFETRVGNTVLPSSADSITAAHPNIPGNGSRVFPGNNPPAASIDATDLFPFTSPYGLFTGSCESNVLPASLVSDLPANVYAHDLRVAPGQAYTVKLFQPAIDVVTQYKGNPVQADVHLTATGPGCGGTLTRTTSPSTGRLADPGFPYGEWTVCAQAVMPNSTLRTSAQVTGVLNDRVDGVGVNLDLPDVTVDTPCV